MFASRLSDSKRSTGFLNPVDSTFSAFPYNVRCLPQPYFGWIPAARKTCLYYPSITTVRRWEGRSLVYTDFGEDMVEIMAGDGIDLKMETPCPEITPAYIADKMLTFYWRKPGFK